jgi:hypothetical protein
VAHDDARAGSRARRLAVDLAHEVVHVQADGEDLDSVARVAWRRPPIARPVGVELDAVVVGIAQVDRLADAVVRRGLDTGVGVGQAPDGARELAAGLEQQRIVVQAGVPPARRGVRLLDQNEQVLGAGAHRRYGAVAVVQPQAQRALVEGDRAVER